MTSAPASLCCPGGLHRGIREAPPAAALHGSLLCYPPRLATQIAVAHLMASAGLDDAAALEAVRHAHPAAQPNPGFLEQLALFGLMGCRLDPGNAGFREFRAYQAALAFAETGALDCAGLADVDSGASSSTKEALHRCRRCRAALARGGNCLEVEAGPGPAAFAWRKRDKLGAGGGATAEPSLWVEPLAWMEPALRDGATQGKLYCPRCGSRLGTYNWAGMQSASGRWVVPAFQLHRSRVDTEAPLARERAAPIARAVPRLLARRQPVVGGARQEGNEAADAGGGAGVNTGDGGDAGPGAATDAIPGPAQASAGASGDGESTGAADTAAALEGGLGTGVRPTPAGGATAAIGPPASLPSFPAFTHLILDCDGVMVDSERPSCESLRLAVKQVPKQGGIGGCCHAASLLAMHPARTPAPIGAGCWPGRSVADWFQAPAPQQEGKPCLSSARLISSMTHPPNHPTCAASPRAGDGDRRAPLVSRGLLPRLWHGPAHLPGVLPRHLPGVSGAGMAGACRAL